MIGLRLTTLLLCVTLCWTQDTEWDWPCGNVTVQDGVNISQLLGVWHVAAIHGISLVQGVDKCYFGEVLSPNQNHSSLDFRFFISSTDGCIFAENTTVNVISPSKWIGQDNWAVLDIPPEGNTLAIAGCGNSRSSTDNTPREVVIVFTKSEAPDLQPVYNKIQAAGLSETVNFTLYNTSCAHDCV